MQPAAQQTRYVEQWINYPTYNSFEFQKFIQTRGIVHRVNVSLLLGQRCRWRTSNKPAITARAVSVSVQRQQPGANTGTTPAALAASKSDMGLIETANAVTVWLSQC